MIRVLLTLLALAVWPASLAALDLPATAQQLSERDSPLDSYALPVGPFVDGAVPDVRIEGRIERLTWRVSGTATTLQLLAPLREQFETEGYRILFDCVAAECGGFDFRFGTEIVPAPDMHVDIRDYRFLSAVRGQNEGLSLLISRNRSTAYVQLIRVTPAGQEPTPITPASPATPVVSAPVSTVDDDIPPADVLIAQGHLALGDLDFVSGANRLGKGPYASLEMLAGFLADHPDYRIVVVGHTDSVGALQPNISLSKKRAETVRQRLISAHDAPADRISAEGMGFLAPRASNLTPEGREQNRRVEVILLSNN